MAKLSRAYLYSHMTDQSGSAPTADEQERLVPFADQLIDQLLMSGQAQFATDDEEMDEIELTIPVKIRPVANAPMGGCVEICVGVGIQVCYHRGYKGDNPGTG